MRSCSLSLKQPALTQPWQAMLGDAVLMEPRPLQRLPLVLTNVRSVLPQKAWTVHFWYGPHNKDLVMQEPQLVGAAFFE